MLRDLYNDKANTTIDPEALMDIFIARKFRD
jgi:hypothetical protein